MIHPLNNRRWSEVGERLRRVLTLVERYLELQIKELEKSEKQNEQQ